MVRFKKIRTAIAVALAIGGAFPAGLGVPHAAAAGIQSLMYGNTIWTDDSYAAQHVDNNGNGRLDIGDTLRGVIQITDVRNSGGSESGSPQSLGGIELLAIFEIEVLSKTAVGPGIFDFTFGPHAAFAQALGLPSGAMLAFYSDTTQEFDPVSSCTPNPSGTCESRVTNGTLELVFGMNSSDADETWRGFSTTDAPSMGSTIAPTVVLGHFSANLSLLFNNTGRLFTKVVVNTPPPYAGDGLADGGLDGSIFGTHGFSVGYSLSADVRLRMSTAVTWNGGQGSWSQGAKWDTGTPPAINDHVFIDGGKTARTSHVSLSGAATIYSLMIDPGDRLTIAGPPRVPLGFGRLSVRDVDNAGTLTISGRRSVLAPRSGSTITNTGNFVVQNAGQVTAEGSSTYRQTAGSTSINSLFAMSQVHIWGGTISGNGLLIGNLSLNGAHAEWNPGNTLGTMAVKGKALAQKGTINLEAGDRIAAPKIVIGKKTRIKLYFKILPRSVIDLDSYFLTNNLTYETGFGANNIGVYVHTRLPIGPPIRLVRVRFGNNTVTVAPQRF